MTRVLVTRYICDGEQLEHREAPPCIETVDEGCYGHDEWIARLVNGSWLDLCRGCGRRYDNSLEPAP